ncbi:AGE family epimerase/isomerase [Demequina aurantiaca]|uniref:AGE family epimerase/isomerase n=1 Tax=Demequina aurantiaca TaxID=676200 RepID=UPI00078378A4|nr:AGE family epimerase/isomerase [Demequina aurantiaca]
MRPEQRIRERAKQRSDLLRFTRAARTDRGFGWLDERGKVVQDKPEELWITCRMTHIAALGVLANEQPEDGGPDYRELRTLVDHGVRTLSSVFEDQEYGGWWAAVDAAGPVNTAKQAYGHAFVVLAASSALLAGADGARALLKRALQVSESRFWDEEQGLSVEEWDRDWLTLETYRGVNANMHTVEAYLAAGDATGDGIWHERAGRIAARVLSWAESNDWRIPEHFDEAWHPMLEHHRNIPADPFRPYGATVGHGLEWARLFLSVDATLGDNAPPGLMAGARTLYGRAVTDGWNADGELGFVYTTDWDGRPVVRERMHWVAAEAIAAAHALAIATGEQRYADDAESWWRFVDEFLVDAEFGSWHHELDSRNVPAASVWPGKPDTYHAYQAALWPDVPLAPSFATALARGVDLSVDRTPAVATDDEELS